jgi:ferredoxin
MDLEIHIDRARCIGSGQCVYVAPRSFDQDREAKAIVTDSRGEPEEKIVHAVTACPVQAITLHVDTITITADDLKDWARGTHSEDPLVPLLEQLCADHHELSTALAATAPDPTPEDASEICSLTRTHLRNEDAAYSAMAAMIDPRLVDAFDTDHEMIMRALDELAEPESDPARRGKAMLAVAAAVGDHIRLEETVLFPVVLAALAP